MSKHPPLKGYNKKFNDDWRKRREAKRMQAVAIITKEIVAERNITVLGEAPPWGRDAKRLEILLKPFRIKYMDEELNERKLR